MPATFDGVGYKSGERVYQENTYATEDIPSFSVVPRERQKAIVRYFLDLEKNLSWLSNERIERELEVSNPAKYEVANRILPTLFGRLNAIAFTAEKGSEYTVEECMDDIYRDVWEGTFEESETDKHGECYDRNNSW